MNDPRILIISIIFLIVGVFLFFGGFKWLKYRRIIENTPTSKIRSIAMGIVEIFGEALPMEGNILKSPFSNTECVYYKYTVEEYKKRGKSSEWVVIKEGNEMPYFFIKDETGSVIIDPKGAEIEIPVDFEFSSSLGKDPPEQIINFLKANSLNFEGFLGINKKMRYREHLIEPKDKLYVMGTAGDNPFVDEGSSQKNEADIMIQKGNDFYYISDKAEKEVLNSFKWKSVGWLFGGSALIILSLFMIFLFIGIL